MKFNNAQAFVFSQGRYKGSSVEEPLVPSGAPPKRLPNPDPYTEP